MTSPPPSQPVQPPPIQPPPIQPPADDSAVTLPLRVSLSRGVVVLRGFSGVVAAGLGLLAVVMVGAQVLAGQLGFPGPGAASVVGHLLAWGVAFSLQRLADRRRGIVNWLAPLGVLAVVALALWLLWWF